MQTLPEARIQAGAESAALSQGLTAYRVAGKRGPWVVLVHGLITPSYAWEPLAETLAGQGFRVLRYDQFGRGLSDRPSVRYDLDLYVAQLRELLDALSIESAHFIGWSMGGLILTRFAAEDPERATSLTLIAPGLYAGGALAYLAKLVSRLPGARKLLARRVGDAINRLDKQHLSRPERFPDYNRRASEQLGFPGMAESFASTVTNYPANAGDQWAAVGQHPRRVLVVWGTRDRVTPYENNRRVTQLFVRSELLSVDGAKHAPHVDHAEVVFPAISRHLAGAANQAENQS
ncbi:hypothetical protein A5634_17030 [Mycobacterium asiaticum]|uniref:AB hydrolase-1 domain-containing protein n=1 Tax=Mycobacterium asiaticum TaxID=1790 RepID=A0A1A3PBJ6_MYCAS|nr:alpha/beta hydrolase [Mycobacterium asiaticum]OBK29977.1 hypothetical protein A5634_17030 [Mycobacterium asiaticum]